ncbi:MAG: hypothetical protein GY756_04015, partial [bacterium]|nr:hypothetical protein [bacterium]
VYSLAVDSAGTVYVGAVNEFGFLAPDSLGSLQYNSLSVNLDSALQNFKYVREICIINHSVYFGTRNQIFKYNPTILADSSSALKIIKPHSNYFSGRIIYNVGEHLFAREKNVGLIRIINDKPEILKGTIQNSGNYIYPWTLMPIADNEILIGTSYKTSIYNPDSVNTNSVYQFNTDADSFFKANKLYHGTAIANDLFLFATQKKGIVVINESGD